MSMKKIYNGLFDVGIPKMPNYYIISATEFVSGRINMTNIVGTIKNEICLTL